MSPLPRMRQKDGHVLSPDLVRDLVLTRGKHGNSADPAAATVHNTLPLVQPWKRGAQKALTWLVQLLSRQGQVPERIKQIEEIFQQRQSMVSPGAACNFSE